VIKQCIWIRILNPDLYPNLQKWPCITEKIWKVCILKGRRLVLKFGSSQCKSKKTTLELFYCTVSFYFIFTVFYSYINSFSPTLDPVLIRPEPHPLWQDYLHLVKTFLYPLLWMRSSLLTWKSYLVMSCDLSLWSGLTSLRVSDSPGLSSRLLITCTMAQ